MLDTTEKLWGWYFKVRVPYLQSRDINELKLTGVNVTGVKEIDNDIQNQWVTTMMPIAYMVELYQKHIPVKVVDVKDTKLIYDYISEHLHAWRDQLQRGINVGSAPIDDLVALDEFANLVYEHAKHQFTREIADNLMGKHLQSIHHFNIHNFFNPSVLQNIETKTDGILINGGPSNDIPERESMSEFFKDKVINLGRRWR